MTTMEDAQIETLKREFEDNRDRIWADPHIPPDQKQAEVDRLWRQFDAQRTELRQALNRGEVPAGTSSRPAFFAGKRRRPLWK